MNPASNRPLACEDGLRINELTQIYFSLQQVRLWIPVVKKDAIERVSVRVISGSRLYDI